jgi:hypothetical protein
MSSEVMQVVLMNRARAHGPMLHVCPVLGCSTITMGGTCVEHDDPVTTVFPRGRPYARVKSRGRLRIVGDPLRDTPS